MVLVAVPTLDPCPLGLPGMLTVPPFMQLGSPTVDSNKLEHERTVLGWDGHVSTFWCLPFVGQFLVRTPLASTLNPWQLPYQGTAEHFANPRLFCSTIYGPGGYVQYAVCYMLYIYKYMSLRYDLLCTTSYILQTTQYIEFFHLVYHILCLLYVIRYILYIIYTYVYIYMSVCICI